MPVLYRTNGLMWEEACAYLATKAQSVLFGELNIQTLQSNAWHLHDYLGFCEAEELDPMTFGSQRFDKPTYRYRGHLIQQTRAVGSTRIATTTAAARIRSVVSFYQWAMDSALIDVSTRPFVVRQSAFHSFDTRGMARRVAVRSTDLAIRSLSRSSSAPEGGLMPVSREVRDEIIRTAYAHSSKEFALMLDLGFRSGMRIQSICGLTVQGIQCAKPGEVAGVHYVQLGPKYGIPTKLGVNYSAQLPTSLLTKLLEYADSSRRLARVRRAQEEHQDLVFLTKFGRPYRDEQTGHACTVSQEMYRLKRGLPHLDLREFYFHCSRATFGTSIVLAGLEAGERTDQVLSRVRQLLGHKHTQTSLSYIAFVEEIQLNERIDEELFGGNP